MVEKPWFCSRMVRIQKIVFIIIVVLVVILGVGWNIYDRSTIFVRRTENVQHILLSTICASSIVRIYIQCPLGARIRIRNNSSRFKIVLNNVNYLNALIDIYQRNASKQTLNDVDNRRDQRSDEMYNIIITDKPIIGGEGLLNLNTGIGTSRIQYIDQQMIITSESQEIVASIAGKKEKSEYIFTMHLSTSFADIIEQERKNEVVSLLFFSRLRQHLYGEDLLQRDYTSDVLDDFKIAHIDGNKYPIIVLP